MPLGRSPSLRPPPHPVRPERFHRLVDVLDRRQPDLTVLMEKVHKAHNFSAVLRSCDSVGVLEAHAVPPDDGLDLDAEISASAAQWIPVRRHDSVSDGVARLKESGMQVLAAHPGPGAVDYRAPDLTRPTAILLGTELYGVTDEALELADGSVEIPMAGMIRSLNVSVAAALLLYEAYRQRDAAGFYDECRLDPERRRRILFEWAYPRIAEHLRRRGRPYPRLGQDGEILDPVT